MERRSRVSALVLVILSVVCFWSSAEAVPIDYRFTGMGVFGAINNTEFNDSKFVVSITGDTNNVVSDAFGRLNAGLSGSITLTGGDLGGPVSGTFTNPLYVFVDNGSRIAGFGDDVTQFDLIDLYAPNVGLQNYDLKTAFGPMAAGIDFPGTTLVNLFQEDIQLGDMSFGTLLFDQVDNGMFQALGPTAPPAQTPEPGTLAFLVPAFAALFGFRRKLTV